MTLNTQKNKKVISKKITSKKEIEIPIYVVGNLEKKEEIKAEPTRKSGESEVFCQIPSKMIPNFADNQKTRAEFNKFKKDRAVSAFKPVIENLPIEKRKTLMWFLVIFLAGLIFLGWIFITKNSLSVQLSQNKQSIFAEIKQGWAEVPELWQETFNSNSFGSSEALDEEKINKFKEKVLEAANAKDTINQNQADNTNEADE